MKKFMANWRISFLLALLLPVSWCIGQSLGPFPLPIHAGRIERLERIATPVDFVQLEQALVSSESSPPDLVPDTLRAQISPPTGEIFLVFTVAIQAGRSLSTLDYRLQAQGREFECKGMALESNNAYDLRRVVQKGPAVVKLLFNCPEKADQAVLTNAFPHIPMTKIPTIVLLEPEEETKEQTDAVAEEDKEEAVAEKPEQEEDKGKQKSEADKKADKKAAAKKTPVKKKAETEDKKKTAAKDEKPVAKEEKAAAKEEKPAAKEAKPAPKPAAKPAEDLWF